MLLDRAVDIGVTPVQYEAILKNLKRGNERHAVEMANELKPAMRTKYARAVMGENDYLRSMQRSSAFWALYETINRVMDPDDPVYSIVNSGATLSTTGDLLTVQAASAGQARILEILIGGEATASAVNRVFVQRAGTAITANSAITPEKFNSRSASASGTYGKAGTQALVGNPMQILAFNAFGGFIRWLAAPGEEMYYLNSEVISLRSSSGTSVVSGTVIFEEL